MIVDAHCHAGTGDGLTGPWDTHAPLSDYLRRADAAGIGRTVVFAPFHSDYRIANANTARIVARNPDRLVGFAFVAATRDRGRIAALIEEAVVHYHFRGIKAHAIDGRATRELCEAARRFRLPILYDVVGKPDVIDLLAPQYPDVTFIVPHLGSFVDDWRAHRTVIDQIARLPNVYADTSGVRRFDYVVEAVRRAGAGKLIFGSDGPWLHPGLELEKIRLLRLPPDQERLVTGETILRLLAGSGEMTSVERRSTSRSVPRFVHR